MTTTLTNRKETSGKAARPPVEERRARRRAGLTLGVPPVAWIAFFLFLPYAYLLILSLWRVNPLSPYLPVVHDWNIDSYLRILQEPAYLKVLLRSLVNGLCATAAATVLGFPIAYFLAFKVSRRRMFWYMLVIVPLWVSYLVRAYAWKVILGDYGVVNGALRAIGLTDHPVHLLYSRFAVILTLSHVFTPFMILTSYAILERIPRSLVEASYDLGIGRLKTFAKVTLPLSWPGILAGAFFTLGLASGDFVAPSLVGGASDVMIAQQIYQEFGAVNNRPFAAALGFTLLCLVMVLVFMSSWLEKREQIDG